MQKQLKDIIICLTVFLKIKSKREAVNFDSWFGWFFLYNHDEIGLIIVKDGFTTSARVSIRWTRRGAQMERKIQ